MSGKRNESVPMFGWNNQVWYEDGKTSSLLVKYFIDLPTKEYRHKLAFSNVSEITVNCYF